MSIRHCLGMILVSTVFVAHAEEHVELTHEESMQILRIVRYEHPQQVRSGRPPRDRRLPGKVVKAKIIKKAIDIYKFVDYNRTIIAT